MNPPISSQPKVRSNNIKHYHLYTGLVSFIANNGQLRGEVMKVRIQFDHA